MEKHARCVIQWLILRSEKTAASFVSNDVESEIGYPLTDDWVTTGILDTLVLLGLLSRKPTEYMVEIPVPGPYHITPEQGVRLKGVLK
ncbi:MAG: hypothetical protein G01um101438_947 [Parcubacteria group bacterium Gr01-1014_38]|nr:MAG: hypothetical protein G01um101438_947 [Parcubacteria group bacterium Gr01-1014_38]